MGKNIIQHLLNFLGSTAQSEEGAENKSETGAAIKTTIYQELDDAFTTLDEELENQTNSNQNQTESNQGSNSLSNNEGLIYSAPTSI